MRENVKQSYFRCNYVMTEEAEKELEELRKRYKINKSEAIRQAIHDAFIAMQQEQQSQSQPLPHPSQQ